MAEVIMAPDKIVLKHAVQTIFRQINHHTEMEYLKVYSGVHRF